MTSSSIDRLKAGAIHLGISAVIATLSACLIFLVWYPAPLARIQGVDDVVMLMMVVDVLLGPVLTVAVFRRGKRGLTFDLAVIALLQAVALLYGLHTIFIARPVRIVFNVDRFDVVAAVDIDVESLARARVAGKPGLGWFGPMMTVASAPRDRKENAALTFSALSGGPDLPQLPHLQVPYDLGRDRVVGALRPVEALRKTSRLTRGEWSAFMSSLPRPPDAVGWLPLLAKAGEAAVVIDRQSGEVIRIEPMSVF